MFGKMFGHANRAEAPTRATLSAPPVVEKGGTPGRDIKLRVMPKKIPDYVSRPGRAPFESPALPFRALRD
jgi:hypothetical protein